MLRSKYPTQCLCDVLFVRTCFYSQRPFSKFFGVNNINRPSDIASCDSTRNYFCKSRSTNGFQSGGIAAIAI